MADRTSKISELPVANGLTSDDLLVVVDSPGSAGATKRITVGNAVGNLQSNVSITGTLTSTQTAYLQSVSVGGTLVINATGSWVGNTTGLKGEKGESGANGANGSSLSFTYEGPNLVSNTQGEIYYSNGASNGAMTLWRSIPVRYANGGIGIVSEDMTIHAVDIETGHITSGDLRWVYSPVNNRFNMDFFNVVNVTPNTSSNNRILMGAEITVVANSVTNQDNIQLYFSRDAATYNRVHVFTKVNRYRGGNQDGSTNNPWVYPSP